MRKTGLALTAVLLVTASLSGVAMADVITASDTTYADQWDTPDVPKGSPANLLAGYNWDTRPMFMKFDLSGYSVPANHKIDSVTLNVAWAWSSDSSCNGDVLTAFVSDDTWTESTLTFNNKPAYGAELARAAWVAFAYAAMDVTDVFKTELAGDGVLSLGVFSDAGAEIVYVAGRNSDNPNLRPILIVTTSEIPEPATMGLLTIGGVLTLLRRRA